MCIIAVDYDNTISANFEAARIALQILRSKGHKVIIWSSRNNPRQHKENQLILFKEMLSNLQKYNIPYDEVDDGTVGKFHAQVYIDDKAIQFKNNWDEIIERIY